MWSDSLSMGSLVSKSVFNQIIRMRGRFYLLATDDSIVFIGTFVFIAAILRLIKFDFS